MTGLSSPIKVLGDDADTLVLSGAWTKDPTADSDGLIIYTLPGTPIPGNPPTAVTHTVKVHPDVQVVKLISGGANADNLTGTGSGDLMIGGAGDDTLLAGAGNDTLLAGTGNDSIAGGDGIDTVDFTAATTPMAITLGLAGAAGSSVDTTVGCLLYTSPSPRDTERSRMPSSA